jgi:cellulose synthase/poly-beta-1,6-N-acetylglucosamine synthase-like glycosyltransferase
VKLVFWLSLAMVLYTYAGYPLLIWMLAHLRPKPWKRASINPSVSVVMAVHNGAPLLPHKIAQLLSLGYSNLREVIVVSDGSTDETKSILDGFVSSKLRKIILRERGGKAVALNAGIAAATSEILLFVDIRPTIAPGAVTTLISNFADPEVGCVAGELVLRQSDHDAGTRAIGGVYWRYEQWIRRCEAQFDSPLGVCGAFYAVRRELAELIPGGTILDDMYQPMQIVRKGYRSVLDGTALVYDMLPKESANEFKRKVRTLAGNYQLFELAPWLLVPGHRLFFQLWSHKVLRLCVPYLLILMFVGSSFLGIHSKTFMVIAAAQAMFYILSLASHYWPLGRAAGVASAFCMLNVAVLVGFQRFLVKRDLLWQSWDPIPVFRGDRPAGGEA